MKSAVSVSKRASSLPAGLIWFTAEDAGKWALRAYHGVLEFAHPPRGERFVEDGALWLDPQGFADEFQRRLAVLVERAFDRGVGQSGAERFSLRALAEGEAQNHADRMTDRDEGAPSAPSHLESAMPVADADASSDGARLAVSVLDARHSLPLCDVPAEPAFSGDLK